MKSIAILLVLAAAAACFVTSDTEWSDYKKNHNKLYETLEEEQFRKNIFEKNRKMVEEHNKKYEEGLVSFTMGINQFSDQTDEENRRYAKCLFKSDMQSSNASRTQYVMLPNVTVPDAMDWRDKGAVTGIKDQGKCGSCWAFSTTGSIEAQHFLRTKNLVELSEQNLIDCVKDNYGCGGGWMDPAFKYIIRNGGIDTEDGYAYEDREWQCRFKKDSVGATISSYVDIKQDDEEALRQAVALKGPVSVAIYADPAFMTYKGGVFNNPNCTGHVNHGVLVVGYGADPSGADYWIVKNSWGKRFGMNGYILMSRNKNNQCGIASHASYPQI